MVATVCSDNWKVQANERGTDISCFQKWGRLVRFVAQEDGQEHIGEPVDENQDGKPAHCQHREKSVQLLLPGNEN